MVAIEKTSVKTIIRELLHHIPFTAFGAVTGIILMVILVLSNATQNISEAFFHTLHPAHVILSALVTTAMYRRYGRGGTLAAVLIGYFGTVVPATLSDAVIPYLGGTLLNVEMELHLPLIETGPMPYIGLPVWLVINLAAFLGIAIGYFKPGTRFPHATHVLLSTWASLFSFTAFGTADWFPILIPVAIFLFFSVWLPCCVSDIVFPLLWGVREDVNKPEKARGFVKR